MGDNSTKSSSEPLSAGKRQEIYNAAITSMFGNSKPMSYDEYLRSIDTDNRNPNASGNISGYQQYLTRTNRANEQAQALQSTLLGMRYDSPQYTEARTARPMQRTDAKPVIEAQYTRLDGPANATYRDAGPVQTANYTDAGPTRSGWYVDAGPAQTLSGGDYNRLEQSVLESRLAPIQRQLALDRQNVDEDLARRGIYSSGLAVRAQNDLSERYAPTLQAAAAEAATQRYGLQSNEQNNLNQFALTRANQGTQYSLANAGMLNEGDLARANAANQFTMANAGMLNEGNLARANAANTFTQTDAARRDQYGITSANSANTFNTANAAMVNEGNLARANAANQFETNRYGAETAANQGAANARNAFAVDQAEKQYQAKWRPADYMAGMWNGTGGVISSSSGGGWSI